MTQVSVRTRLSRKEIKNVINNIPKELRTGPLSQELMQEVGMVILGLIKKAFITKARGGTDESGLRWAPLSPVTIARRLGRTRPKPKKKAGYKGIKGKAPADFDKYAGSVEILIDSGKLLDSLTPASTSDDQVLNAGNGTVAVGTSVEYASKHHHGIPGKLPRRRLWPEPNKWPKSWWNEILNEIRTAIMDLVVDKVRGNGT